MVNLQIDDADLKKALRDLTIEITHEIFNESQENLVKLKADGRIISDTGLLMRSGKVIPTSDGAKIVYDANYASHVEWGTVPHKVPILPLQRWVKRKLGVKDDKKVKSIAFAISNTIGKRGLEPTRFLRNALDKVKVKYEAQGVKLESK